MVGLQGLCLLRSSAAAPPYLSPRRNVISECICPVRSQSRRSSRRKHLCAKPFLRRFNSRNRPPSQQPQSDHDVAHQQASNPLRRLCARYRYRDAKCGGTATSGILVLCLHSAVLTWDSLLNAACAREAMFCRHALLNALRSTSSQQLVRADRTITVALKSL